MKLVYLLNQRFPTEKAYGRQISKMCSSFAKTPGVDLELVYPTRQNLIKDDPFDYYDIKNNFKITKVRVPDFYWPGRLNILAFGIKSLLSALILIRTVLTRNPDVIYSRDELPLYILSFFRKNLVFEAHKMQGSRTFMNRRFKKNKLRTITITRSLRDEFIKLNFVPANILVAPDGVDSEAVEKEEKNPSDINSARRMLDLQSDKKIAVYTGSLYRWKGVYTLVDAAKLIPEVLFMVVGGDERGDETELRRYLAEEKIENVIVTGYIREAAIRDLYRAAANVLVLPNTSREKISELYTSPLKLFSYMAAKRPIVASDLPSLREVLNSQNSVLVKPDDPKALATGINWVFENKELAEELAHNAFEAVRGYTWQQRAAKILDFINGNARAETY